MNEEITQIKENNRKFFSTKLSALILFLGILISTFVAAGGVLLFYGVALKDSIVPNINGPVSRFIANIDFETQTVSLDATISKTIDAEEKIAIWRFGDGKVIKSVGLEEIEENEVLEYQFQKPGTYVLGYSIVDTNDLSDEAYCTITFVDESKKITKTNPEAPTVDGVDVDCGKSTTAYNNQYNVETLNSSRAEIRLALFNIGLSLVILLGTLIFNKLVRRLFVER